MRRFPGIRQTGEPPISLEPDHVQTRREITDLLLRYGLNPRKRFGQHFLVDGNTMRNLVQSAEIESGDLVLEVGCGTGGLTDLLVSRAETVIGVEIDKGLRPVLADRFADAGNFTFIEGDILASKHQLHGEVVRALTDRAPAAGSIKLVANLPYQIATPLIMNLIVDFPQVKRLCFTVQAEVGERITAGPCTSNYGPLSIVTQSICSVTTLARLGPQFFWPRPKVDSVMLRLDVGPPPLEDRSRFKAFVSLVRATFDHRRKTLRKALSYVLEPAALQRVDQAVDAGRRPEAFDLEEWITIYRAATED